MNYPNNYYKCIYQTESGVELKIRWFEFMGVVTIIIYSESDISSDQVCGYVSGNKLPTSSHKVKSNKRYYKIDKSGLSICRKRVPANLFDTLIYEME